MAGFAGGWGVEVDRDGYVGERGEGEGEGVGDDFCAGGDEDVGEAGEGEGAVSLRVDGGGVECQRAGEVRGGEVEGFGAEGVGEVDAEGRAAGGEMDDLAEGGVGEVGGGRVFWGSGICCEAVQVAIQVAGWVGWDCACVRGVRAARARASVRVGFMGEGSC